jgi:uncharacterized protein (TIGR02466 family)
MTELPHENFFETPIYRIEKPEWVNKVNKVCNPIISKCKERDKNIIKEKNKKFNMKIGDFGWSYHSKSMTNKKGLEELQQYIVSTSQQVLDNMGFNLTSYNMAITEFWVQEFADKGGGHHSTHVHYDNHISGFYFLKCSKKTSMPFFHDPRAGKLMAQLPMKNSEQIISGASVIHVRPKPGTLIIFPSYLPHEFSVDPGVDPFRFIHFNIQAVRKFNNV